MNSVTLVLVFVPHCVSTMVHLCLTTSWFVGQAGMACCLVHVAASCICCRLLHSVLLPVMQAGDLQLASYCA